MLRNIISGLLFSVVIILSLITIHALGYTPLQALQQDGPLGDDLLALFAFLLLTILLPLYCYPSIAQVTKSGRRSTIFMTLLATLLGLITTLLYIVDTYILGGYGYVVFALLVANHALCYIAFKRRERYNLAHKTLKVLVVLVAIIIPLTMIQSML